MEVPREEVPVERLPCVEPREEDPVEREPVELPRDDPREPWVEPRDEDPEEREPAEEPREDPRDPCEELREEDPDEREPAEDPRDEDPEEREPAEEPREDPREDPRLPCMATAIPVSPSRASGPAAAGARWAEAVPRPEKARTAVASRRERACFLKVGSSWASGIHRLLANRVPGVDPPGPLRAVPGLLGPSPGRDTPTPSGDAPGGFAGDLTRPGEG